MARKGKAPPQSGRASRDLLGGRPREASTLSSIRTQWLAVRLALGPDTAVMIAALAFGGAHG